MQSTRCRLRRLPKVGIRMILVSELCNFKHSPLSLLPFLEKAMGVKELVGANTCSSSDPDSPNYRHPKEQNAQQR